jgi:hypothetical protein
MNQLYTEYLIGFDQKERQAEAARWEQVREARAAGQVEGKGIRTFVYLLGINRPRQINRVVAIPTQGEANQAAM